MFMGAPPERGGEVMNILSPFQTHLDGFTLYIPPYLLCPATPRTKKSNKAIEKKKEKKKKLSSAHRKVHIPGHRARGRFLREFTSFDFENRL